MNRRDTRPHASTQCDSNASERPRLVQVVTIPGSAWALMRGQLAFMREQGFDVTFICDPGPLLQKTAEREGVVGLGVPMKRQPAIFSDLRSLWKMIRLIRRLDPDIVHFSTPKAGLIGSLASLAIAAPIRLYTLRGMRADGFAGWGARLLTALERIPCRIAHRVICVSESLKNRAVELGISDERKLCVLDPQSSNGVDSNRFRRDPAILESGEALRQEIGLPAGVPVIAFVGRLSKEKGVAELMEAFSILRTSFPDLHLLLVGPKESYRGMTDQVHAQMDSDRQIIATGILEDPRPAYAIADCLALPTYREGFPNVLLEAAAMELPVVATRVTGCVDAVVDNETGSLVPPQDANALAEALRRYLQDPELRMRHGVAARERVCREFRPELVWTALLNHYVDLLTQRGLPLPADESDPRCDESRNARETTV